MTRAAALILALLAGSAGDALAQGIPAPLRYGKWALLAGAVGLNVSAAQAHDDADQAFALLEERCEPDHPLCDTDIEGRYVDPISESLYQESLTHDRRSRRFLISGQAALLGSAALFIWEFARPKSPPNNVPFEPTVSVRNGVTRVGMQVRW